MAATRHAPAAGRALVVHMRLVALHGFAVDGEAHRVQPVVDVHSETRHGAGERRAEEGGHLADVVRVEILLEGRVCLCVVDGVLDECLLTLRAADGGGSARLERTGGDGVDGDGVLAAGLVGEHARVRLERSLGRTHSAAVARDDTLGGDVAERDAGAALVHDGSELLHQRHEGVGAGRGGGQLEAKRAGKEVSRGGEEVSRGGEEKELAARRTAGLVRDAR
mmetsp:Transcript_43414/g.107312  ORF Transcript_43414/g.107312 Transcript_43414/m.107312 type:complete len:222 (+) Transcript_43414:190-855(+)